jgi:REP element-mobilizing transposase RayT
LPGSTYLVTRRCSRREYLLRPCDETNEILRYVLAVGARRYGILLHAICVMSNHLHMVLTDPDAQLPEFERYVNAFVARAVNASLGRWESFWAPSSYSAVTLASPEVIVDKIAYVLANPVAAGLVRKGSLWPGVWSDPDCIGAKLVAVSRPRRFFSERKKRGALPETAELELVVPPGFATAAEFRERVVAALDVRQREAQRKYGARGFQGVARVLKQDPFSRPVVPEPRRRLSPRVAARNTGERIAAILRLKVFRREYRDAWIARREGKANVVFPAGTYLLRIAHGVPCAVAG